MENTTVSTLVAALLPFVFEFAPRIRQWWEQLNKAKRSYITAAIIAGITVINLIYNCVVLNVCPPNLDGWIKAIIDVLIPVVVGNQVVGYGLLARGASPRKKRRDAMADLIR